MGDELSRGPFYGRPYGGTAIIMKREFASLALNIISNERLTVVKFSNWLLFNVYMPCSGTVNRQLLYDDILQEIQALISAYPTCNYLIGGDFNVSLDCRSPPGDVVNCFLNDNNLSRCDVLFPVSTKFTYVSESLNCASLIDYMVTSSTESTVAFNILDLDVNLSDHLPLMAVCLCKVPTTHIKTKCECSTDVAHFRWDHAPLSDYYDHTLLLLQPVLDELNKLNDGHSSLAELDTDLTDRLYDRVVNALQAAARQFIPKHKKNFYKFWWNSELDELKENAIRSCKIWKEAGKPKHGPIYNNYRQDKLLYKRQIREGQAREMTSFSNDLHDALLRKSGQQFWKSWKSKFDNKTNVILQLNGTSDSEVIADNFAKYFENVCTPFNRSRNDEFKYMYFRKRATFGELLPNKEQDFSVELLSNLLNKMKNGKAAGLDELTCEHLKYSHPIIIVILCKLFNLFVINGHVPESFGRSYMVPIPKGNVCNRALTLDDFRGISISPVISKLFEHAILDRFGHYFLTSDNQFGFKKNLSCRHVIYNVRNVIEHYTENGSTVSVCSLDLSKAFDRMNQYALLVKLMEKRLPIEILDILEKWFSISVTCVKWNGCVSNFFRLLAGVRQGGVLSPFLFAVFIDSVVDRVKATGVGCYLFSECVSIFLYADDILLIAPSVTALQTLVTACENELTHIDMRINEKKSMCIRFGARHNVECADLKFDQGGLLHWSSQCRYLGVYFVSGRAFKCSFDHSKCQFFKALNAIFSKVGRFTSEEVVLNLIRAKCLPVLLYGVESCPMMVRDKKSMEFTVTRSLMKLFKTGSAAVVSECQNFFRFLPISNQIDIRTAKFLEKFMTSDNYICSLFECHARIGLNKIFSMYDNASSALDVRRAADRLFFC